MTVTGNEQVYVSQSSQMFHLSLECAGKREIVMSLREAAGRYEPCWNCVDGNVLEQMKDEWNINRGL